MANNTGSDSIATWQIVFFMVMWVIFAGLGCWAGVSAGWNFFLALIVGIVGGFVVNCVFMICAALGIDF